MSINSDFEVGRDRKGMSLDIATLSKDKLLDPMTVFEIFENENPLMAAHIENQMIDRAREFKAVGAMKNLIKGARARIAEELKNQATEEKKSTELATQGETSLINVNDVWTNNEHGVYKQLPTGQYAIACFHPIRIKEILEDLENQKCKVVLEYQKDNRTREITVSRQTIADYHKILDLSNYGVGVTSETAKNLVQYFSLAELEMGPDTIKKSLSRFGWWEHEVVTEDHKERVFDFVPYCQEIQFAADEALSNLKKAFTWKALEDNPELDWMEMYKSLRKRTKEHPEPQLFVSAALASVLIGPLNETPFLLNLWSETGAGKTITLKVAASVWGNPNQYISDSDSTVNALVAKAAILYDLPLIADDFAKATRDNKQLSNLVYALSAGKEKDRLNSESQLKGGKRWHSCTLSTNEFPLADDSLKGGAINRVLDIQGAPGAIFEDPGKVIRTCDNSYGSLGATFILHLQSNKDSFKEIRTNQDKIFKQLKSQAAADGRTLEDKQTLPLSLILAVDEYIEKYLIRDGVRLKGKDLIKHLKSREQVSDGERAYSEIIDFVDSNRIKFVDLGSEGGAANSRNLDVYGYMEPGGKIVHFLPTMFNKLMAESGRNVKAFCRWASDKGVLIARADSGNQNSKCINGKTKRVYSLNLEPNPFDIT